MLASMSIKSNARFVPSPQPVRSCISVSRRNASGSQRFLPHVRRSASSARPRPQAKGSPTVWRHGATRAFIDRVAALALPADLQAEMEPLVRAMQSVNAQLAALAQRPETMAQDDEVVERWRTAPGVGPLTARSFVATLDAVERFDHAHQVES